MEGERRAMNDDLSNFTEDVPHLAAATSSGANVEIGDGDGEHQETDVMSSSSNNSLGACSTAGGNPLENPVILNHLFQLCPVATVASCRLVSKRWYDESLATWRTAFPLTMVTENTQIFLGRSQRTPLQEFLEFSTNPDNRCVSLPYRNLQINEIALDLLSEEFKIFWSSVRINLNTLNLSSCTFSSIEEFRQIIYTACPVLQKLSIRSCTFTFKMASGRETNNELDYVEPLYGDRKLLKSLTVAMEDEKFPVSWIELFSHFSSLEYFQCTNSSTSWLGFPESQVETLIHAIQAIRKNDKKKLPLKHFQTDPDFEISLDLSSHRRFALVKELRLPLKSCSIELHSEMDRTFWNDTLEYLAASLNAIKLLPPDLDLSDDLYMSTSRNFPFGIQLNNLTRLDLQGDHIANFQFLKYTPNLSTLNISGTFLIHLDGVGTDTSYTEMVSNTCKEELSNLQMTRLTTFKLCFGVYNEDIHYLYRWMPNITNLTMILNDYQFGMVCQGLKNLRRLTVKVKAYDDKPLTEEGVTGMGRGKEFGIRPVIANLEALESLVFDLGLTTESVFHLFLRLPTLQILKHGVCTRFDEIHVQREDLDDLSSYQRAISRCSYYAANVDNTSLSVLLYNVIERWVAENPNGLNEKLTDGGRMAYVPGRKLRFRDEDCRF